MMPSLTRTPSATTPCEKSASSCIIGDGDRVCDMRLRLVEPAVTRQQRSFANVAQ